ncbi:DUF4105 domain-containing protein [Lutibacter sp. TH_r2]|uniref:lipoprotein N-acyltransferase Lnb domain-containing protein n=1 Tax=Lutibacter sp. TH_r2 TaxID=3082083 RepID=UPI0029536539|nr:DUF4105 domain-containing protein [Lutibacter sp. TH_r2]MDV7187484.1 DUF4105 domain-containing protein [Lutibacter sp. TH_r2]
MSVKKLLFGFFLLSFIPIFGQFKLSNKATVSVITCGPYNELYSTFGHSAFRIHDPINGVDWVYNYGTFDFDAPNFYLNFAKGKLTYQLSKDNFNRFIYVYNYQKRWVKSQVLNLNANETLAVFNYLENNAKPENKNYKYDFFYNNCATKIEDVVKDVLQNNVEFPNNHITTTKSHRDLIEDYTKNQKWGKFGIDLALGSVIDDTATPDEYKFLPDYIYLAFENATILRNGKKIPLVKKNIELLNHPIKNSSNFPPIGVTLIIALLVIWITRKDSKKGKRRKWLDFSLYFITGLTGVVILLLWFATDHTATYKNFNFLWAFAPNIVVAFYLLKSKIPKWIVGYNLLLIVLIILTLILWLFKVQVFNWAIVPILALLNNHYAHLNKIIRLNKAL